eukprot:PhM_4_TR1241/c0_g1_i1/m.28273
MGKFTFRVSADLYGQPKNIEVSFNAVPTLAALKKEIHGHLSIEANLCRPIGAPPPGADFGISRLQARDAGSGKWRDLRSQEQLTKANLHIRARTTLDQDTRSVMSGKSTMSGSGVDFGDAPTNPYSGLIKRVDSMKSTTGSMFSLQAPPSSGSNKDFGGAGGGGGGGGGARKVASIRVGSSKSSPSTTGSMASRPRLNKSALLGPSSSTLQQLRDHEISQQEYEQILEKAHHEAKWSVEAAAAPLDRDEVDEIVLSILQAQKETLEQSERRVRYERIASVLRESK